MNATIKANLGIVARVLVGLAFIISGFHKAVAPPQDFAAVMEAYYILPESWLMPFATLMPWAQLLFGVFLAAGYLTRLSAAAITGMLAVFFGALLSTRIRGVPLDHCGCFGNVILTPTQAMGIDAVLLALAVCAYRYGRGRLSLDIWIDAGTDAATLR